MFLVSLIPYILFMIVCQSADRRCYTTPLQQLIVLLYECYSRRVLWRTIDQLAALIVQIRIYWDDIKAIFVKTPSTTTPVVFLN
uniref:Secreted protein n=1 Tax=Acrobeloides nanus TaxID=290746 RepID=A0A914D0Q3_9BILA